MKTKYLQENDKEYGTIKIYGDKMLTKSDLILFCKRCYKLWNVFPVSDVDLLIQYHIDKSSILYRSCGDILVSDLSNLFKNREVLDKTVQNYIIAKIRNGNVKEIKINKIIRVAH